MISKHWRMQVLVRVEDHFEWHDVHPVRGPAYEYASKEEAEGMLRLCYSDLLRHEQPKARVVEVES